MIIDWSLFASLWSRLIGALLGLISLSNVIDSLVACDKPDSLSGQVMFCWFFSFIFDFSPLVDEIFLALQFL